jgi:uncharacterized protein with FMN-binding domain
MDANKMRKIAGVMFGMVAILIVVALMIPAPQPVSDYSGALTEDAVKAELPSTERGAQVSVVDGGVVTVTRTMKPNLTPAMMLSGGRIDTIEVFEALFEDPRIEQVMVISNTEFTDKYGQSTKGAGCWYRLSRATADRVNWDVMPFENLDQIADAYFVHPALR